MTGYTVIDVETTGLSPRQQDRVIELAVVYVDDSGQIQGEWETLINPQRDVGPTRIHGITARDVLNAPTFKDLAPYVLRAVSGRTIVAHNASFDIGFLDSEFVRAGVPIHSGRVPSVCTMEWSTAFLDAPSRRLHDCCGVAGVAHQNTHSALGDARATAQLLARFISASRGPVPWLEMHRYAAAFPWPSFLGQLPSAPLLPRSSIPAPRPDEWLDRIVSKLPRLDDAKAEAYLEVLDSALADNYLSAHEQVTLGYVANDLGLTVESMRSLHRMYVNALADAALEDGIVTAEERRQLESVAVSLGLGDDAVDQALTRNRQVGDVRSAMRIELVPGDRVVFTGDLDLGRDVWMARARAVGLDPGGVTKKARVVVAADPDSQSRKSEKARVYGVPIITESAFDQIFSVYCKGGWT